MKETGTLSLVFCIVEMADLPIFTRALIVNGENAGKLLLKQCYHIQKKIGFALVFQLWTGVSRGSVD